MQLNTRASLSLATLTRNSTPYRHLLNRDLTLALDAILNHKIAIETKIRATEESAMRCLEDVERD